VDCGDERPDRSPGATGILPQDMPAIVRGRRFQGSMISALSADQTLVEAAESFAAFWRHPPAVQ
jgi:hypothetical protein